MPHETICGYDLADIRRNLRDVIDRRDGRAAGRWTAELVATPGAIGSLWASYWLAWAVAQGAGTSSPTLPILLNQTWDSTVQNAQRFANDWSGFRNDPQVRATCSEMTKRLILQPRLTPVVWPSKEIILYDVSVMRDTWAAGNVPAVTDSPLVLRVWQRDDDAMDLRMMAGQWVHSLQRGDLRIAMSAIAWTLLTPAQQGLQAPLKCAERGPMDLTAKQRNTPLWFWLDIGKSLLTSMQGLHRGWITLHNAIAAAMKVHFKRWTSVERLRIMLAWMLQIRACMTPQPESIWSAPPLQQTLAEVDLPYKEVAADLADPNAPVMAIPNKMPELTAKEEKRQAASRMEEQIKAADAKVLAMMGLSEEDM